MISMVALVVIGLVITVPGALLFHKGLVSLARGRGSTACTLLLALAALAISAIGMVLDMVAIGEPQFLLFETFGTHVSDLVLAVFMVWAMYGNRVPQRFGLCILAFFVMFMVIFPFSGYIGFETTIILILLMFACAIMAMSPVELPGLEGVPREDAVRGAATMAAGYLVMVLAAAMTTYGSLSALEGLVEIQHGFMVAAAACLSVSSLAVPVLMLRRGQAQAAVRLTSAIVVFNCIFILLSVEFLPMVEYL